MDPNIAAGSTEALVYPPILGCHSAGGENVENRAYMHTTIPDGDVSQVTKATYAERTIIPAEHKGFVATASKEQPILPAISRLSATSLPSLGDRFSSINLAHAGLQYFKDRAQSLRSVITAPASSADPPVVATQSGASGHENVQSVSSNPAVDNCTEQAPSSGSDQAALPTDDTIIPHSVDALHPSTLNGAHCSNGGALPTAPSDAQDIIRLTSPMDDRLASAPSLDVIPAIYLSPTPPLALSGALLDVLPAESAISAEADLSLAPAAESYEGLASAINASYTPAINATEDTMNTGDDPTPTRGHKEGLAPSEDSIPATVYAASPADPGALEIPTPLLDFNSPAACLEVAVATDALAGVEAHISPEDMVSSSDNEDCRLTPDLSPLPPQPSEVDAATTLPSLQSQSSAFPDTVPPDLAAAALPDDSHVNIGPESPVEVPDTSSEPLPGINIESLSDKLTVPSDALVMLADEHSTLHFGSACDSVESLAIETIPLGEMADAHGGKRFDYTQDEGGTASTRTHEDCFTRSPATSEGVVGQELHASVDEDEMHLDVSEPHPVSSCEGPPADDNGVPPVDVGVPEASCTTYAGGFDTLVSLVPQADVSMIMDDANDEKDKHAVEIAAEDTQIPDNVALSQGLSPYDMFEVMCPASVDIEDALDPSVEVNNSLDLGDHDQASMQVDEEQLNIDPSEDIVRDDSHSMGNLIARPSSPSPPSSPPYLSSPLRSSSPFAFSSPPPSAFNSSLPTSPVSSPLCHKAVAFQLDKEDKEPEFRNEEVTRSARKRALDDIDDADSGWLTSSECTPMSDEREAKRIKLDEGPLPTPPATQPQSQSLPQVKRPTLASQLRERKKLTAPFRSPLVDKDAAKHGVDAVYASGKTRLGAPAPKRGVVTQKENSPTSAQATPELVASSQAQAVKARTPKVVKQFKSPFHLDASSSSSSAQPSSSTFFNVQAVPTIRTLQSKIQTLKQAIKIKNAPGGNNDDELEELVNKWTNVGREVAWAVWDTVKDIDPGESARLGKQQGGWFSDDDGGHDSRRGGGWGFDDKPAKGEPGEEGEQVVSRGDDEDSRPQHTLGTMLRHMGIAPETLGWDEEEGDFVDVE